MKTVTPQAPWGDIPPSNAAPVHSVHLTDGLVDSLRCGAELLGSHVTVDPEQVTCANCLAEMTAPITGDLGPVAPRTVPPLDTPEARWEYVLTVWRSRNLPTPTQIDVSKDLTVWLPPNERGQVDQWIEALGVDTPAAIGGPTRTDGSPNPWAYYSALSSWNGPIGQRHVLCYLDLTADAAVHAAVNGGLDAVHEHGMTFQQGKGHLPRDPYCVGCRDAANTKYKAAYAQARTDGV